MHSTGVLKNDWKELESNGLCGLIIFGHLFLVASLCCDLWRSSLFSGIGDIFGNGDDASVADIEDNVPIRPRNITDCDIGAKTLFFLTQEALILLIEEAYFFGLGAEPGSLSEFFDDDGCGMVYFHSEGVLGASGDAMVASIIDHGMFLTEIAIASEASAEFRLSEIESEVEEGVHDGSFEGEGGIFRKDSEPLGSHLIGDRSIPAEMLVVERGLENRPGGSVHHVGEVVLKSS